MAIVKWEPWTDLDLMERRMRRFFDVAGFVPAPLPAADVYETTATSSSSSRCRATSRRTWSSS